MSNCSCSTSEERYKCQLLGIHVNRMPEYNSFEMSKTTQKALKSAQRLAKIHSDLAIEMQKVAASVQKSAASAALAEAKLHDNRNQIEAVVVYKQCGCVCRSPESHFIVDAESNDQDES